MLKRIALFLTFLMSVPAFANDPKSLDQVSLRADLIDHLIEVSGSLLLVIVSILAILWVVRKLMRGNFTKNATMKIVGNLPLSTKEKLMLVKVEGVHVLIGVSPGNIQGLHVFDTPFATAVENTNEKTVVSESFLNRMQDAMSKVKG